jgi:hypothetical protein
MFFVASNRQTRGKKANTERKLPTLSYFGSSPALSTVAETRNKSCDFPERRPVPRVFFFKCKIVLLLGLCSDITDRFRFANRPSLTIHHVTHRLKVKQTAALIHSFVFMYRWTSYLTNVSNRQSRALLYPSYTHILSVSSILFRIY